MRRWLGSSWLIWLTGSELAEWGDRIVQCCGTGVTRMCGGGVAVIAVQQPLALLARADYGS